MKRKFIYLLALSFISSPIVKAGDGNLKKDSLKQINWIHYDPSDDSVGGISLNKAYQLLKGRPSKTILVAIIDSGVDIDHEDLKDHVWTNEDEIPGNGIDDDHNGYVDDVHGWNFIGGRDGDITDDTYELTREYVRLSKIYKDKSDVKDKEFEYWEKIKSDYEEKAGKTMGEYENYKEMVHNVPRYFSLVKNYLDTDTLTSDKLDNVTSSDSVVEEALTLVSRMITYYGNNPSVKTLVKRMSQGLDYYENQVKYGYNPEYDSRSIVGDNYTKVDERNYGNNHCNTFSGDQGSHGTHVSGIIAADRNNNKGTIGIADNVKIMAIRTVPTGDERDKDVANAIYYAVNNGAKVINMSFGKDYSPHREAVEKAILAAQKKGVIIVHAAGNDGKDVDTEPNFPTKRPIKGKKEAWNMIEVGASSMNLNEKFTASFSNYGKERVDLFAPGVKVWSTMPNQEYKPSSGTSMAAPVVTGVTALLMEYFPELSSQKIKEILVKSTWKYDGDVYKPGTKEKVKLTDLSSSGGVVNAYEAVKMAMNTLKIPTR
jgi:cell wall-associated protease